MSEGAESLEVKKGQSLSINTSLEVNDEQFAYLKLQKGNLHDFAGHRAYWLQRYREDVAATFASIEDFLPEKCWGLLDVGSGLGGIDVLIARRYQRACGWPFVYLLDGVDDPPVMKLHRETFNSMRVAGEFLRANGLPAERFKHFSPTGLTPHPWDLVVSFGSWGFHYEPNTYLLDLMAPGGLEKGATVILDVRVGKGDWSNQLLQFLDLVDVVAEKEKWRRCVYVVR